MERLIYLKVDWKSKPEVREKAYKQFRTDVKQWPYIKCLQELEKQQDPQPQVLIEFPDNKCEEIYSNLSKLEIVELIDASIPEKE